MSRPFAYEQLCTVAAERGLHVELWTDHRSKQAKDATLGPPVVGAGAAGGRAAGHLRRQAQDRAPHADDAAHAGTRRRRDAGGDPAMTPEPRTRGGVVFIDVDPNAPHDEDCGFWEGGACRCKPEMAAALDRDHCHECDFVHGSGYNRCTCLGQCICDREEGCPCVGRLDAPVEPLR